MCNPAAPLRRTEPSMRIHFLLVKDLFKGGGIETYTRGVGSRLVQRGHQVTVYSTGGDAAAPSTWEGMKIVWLPRMRPYWTEKFFGALVAAYYEMTRESPDIVHLHSVAAGAMAPVLRMRAVPCIVQMHGVEWKRSSWGLVAKTALQMMEACSVKFGNAVTAVSKTQCDYYAARYGADCEYIPTAVDLKPFTTGRLILDLGLRPCEYVLFAARLVPEKGAHYLIPAFRRLDTHLSLVIAGGGGRSDAYQDHLKQLAGGDKRILFLGDIRGTLLDELFSNAAAFIQPSELEGLSIGLIEAMSYGLPCIASDIPENREAVGETGLLFRNRNVDDLERVMSGLLSGGIQEPNAGASARRRVADLYSWDTVVDRLENLYERVSANRKAESDAPAVRVQ